ncbi:MAG TPA: DedA family protein [Candidatus Methylomirabilis sp.]|nr:DedA family protein [Candidatus Methylomirabilis sp.]
MFNASRSPVTPAVLSGPRASGQPSGPTWPHRHPIVFLMAPLLSLPLGQVLRWLIQYRYLLMFPIMVVEGPIITVIAGFQVSLGHLNFFATYALAVTADLLGDSLYYIAGRVGAKGFVGRWGKYLRVTWVQIDRVKRHFERHVGKTLLLGKLTHGAGGLILLAAGVAEVPYIVFLWFNLLGTLPKSLIFLLVGFYFGHGYQRINAYLDDVALVTISVVFLASLGFFFYGNRGAEKR